MPPLTEAREHRLRQGVTLIEAAVFGDFTLARASEIERFPERARPGELERLGEAVDQAAMAPSSNESSMYLDAAPGMSALT